MTGTTTRRRSARRARAVCARPGSGARCEIGRALCLSLLLLLISLPHTAAGQDAPQDLTLAEAKRIAAENNPAYRKAQNNIQTARAQERQSIGAFLPSLSLSATSGGGLSRVLTGSDEYGKPVRRDDPLDVTSSSSSQGISLGLQLFNGGRRYHQLRASRAQGAATSAAMALQATTLDAELTRRYYAAKKTTAQISLEEELLTARQAAYDATEKLLRVAAKTPVDLLGAEIDVAQQQGELEKARGAARKAMLALGEEMGVTDPPDWRLTTEPPPVFDPATLDADSLVARALRSSPAILQSEANLRASEQQRSVAGASRWPSVSASAGFRRSVGSSGYGSLFELNPLNQGFSFGLNLSIPVFNQFQISAQVTQARVAALNAREDLRAARLSRERQVRGALIDLRNAYTAVQLAQRQRDLARRRIDLADRQFRLGSMSFTELQQVSENAAGAERGAIDARYNFANALVALEEAVGGGI